MKGHVARLVADKGFGFITGEDGQDRFFHRSEVSGAVAFEDLREGGQKTGTPVEFESVEAPKGPRAEGVRAIQ